MSRALIIWIALAAASCRDGRGVAVVSVGVEPGGRVPGVDHLDVTVADQAAQRYAFTLPLPMAPVELPPPVRFSLSFAQDYRGTVDVSVIARDAGERPLASAHAGGTIRGDAETDIAIALPGAIATDDAGTSDLARAPGDLAIADLAPPPDLSSADLARLPRPIVSSSMPSTGPSSGGTALTLGGQYFQSGATVTIGGRAAPNVVWISSTMLGVDAPAAPGVAGAVVVTVTNPDGQSGANGAVFSYYLGTLDFAAAPEPTLAGVPTAIAIADLNGDGKGDVVVANGMTTVSVLLGGAATPSGLTMPVDYTVGMTPAALAIGDLDGDGALDVAVAEKGAGGLAVLLGKGDGTLRLIGTTPTGAGADAVALADLDHDGLLDAVVANGSANTVSVLYGSGGGALAPKGGTVPYPTGMVPDAIAIADFNSDGKLDLVIGNESDMFATVLLAKGGTGLFTPGPNFMGAGFVTSIVTADFTGDGQPDLALSGELGFVIVAKALGNGGFQTVPSMVPSWFYVGAIAGADFNSDGKSDLAIAIPMANTVNVMYGLGGGGLVDAVDVGTGSGPVALAVGDVNGDGALDIVSANSAGTLSVVDGQPGGGYHAALDYDITDRYIDNIPVALAVGDFNKDAKLDLVVGSNGDDTVTVFVGRGDGTFARAMGAKLPQTTVSLDSFTVGDFNEDGALDVAVLAHETSSAFSGYVDVLSGDGKGALLVGTTFTLAAAPWKAVTGEFTGDNHVDLAIASFNVNTNYLTIYPGHGDGTFGGAINTASPPTSRPRALAKGDFNHDGLSDLVTVNDDQNINVFLALAGGGFQAPAPYPVGMGFYDLVVADYNADGQMDLIVADQGSSDLAIAIGSGNGSFTMPFIFKGGFGGTVINTPSGIAAADFNLDGVVDFVVTSYNARPLVLATSGMGTFRYPLPLGGESATAVVTGDFDGDQRPDIALVSQSGFNLSVIRNTSR
jgi:hypothetical protein